MPRVLPFLAAALAALTSLAGCLSAPTTDTAEDEVALNLCLGQPAGTFRCIDETRFQHCTGDSRIFIRSCPANQCATRHPPSQNPCVGAAMATRLDGVPPTPPGQIEDGDGDSVP